MPRVTVGRSGVDLGGDAVAASVKNCARADTRPMRQVSVDDCLSQPIKTR